MKWIYYILLIQFGVSVNAQTCTDNLVPNPSFEDTTKHYPFSVFFEDLYNWNSKGSADLYHFCNGFDWLNGTGNCEIPFVDIIFGMPNNWMGYQSSLQGLGYVGIVIYSDYYNVGTNNYREYIQTKLKEPLKPCTEYTLSFYVSLADTSNYASPNMQAAITKDSIYSQIPWIIDHITPTYAGPGYAVTDTANWTLLSYTFMAEGGEQFLTIGDFTSRYDTTLVKVRNDGRELSYYYIDMVSLCEVPKPAQEIPNIITTNGDGLNDVFYVTGLYPDSRLRVYNRWGAEVFDAEAYANNWAGTSKTLGSENQLPDGVYFYVLESHCGGRQTGTITLAGGM